MSSTTDTVPASRLLLTYSGFGAVSCEFCCTDSTRSHSRDLSTVDVSDAAQSCTKHCCPFTGE